MKTPDLPPFEHRPKKYDGPPAAEVLRLRKQFLNPGIFIYYKKPLMIVEGRMQYVFDERGRRHLDATDLNRDAEKCATPQFELSSGHLDSYTKPVHTRIV